MVEVSRDGRRVYFTNSLYGVIDDQFYPDGVKGWMVKLDAKPGGGIELDRGSSWSGRTATGRTRCACREATPLRTPTAIRDGRCDRPSRPPAPGGRTDVAVAGPGGARRVPRDQPRHGLAVRGRARPPSREPRRWSSSLIPIAIGHALAVALVVLAVVLLGRVVDQRAVSLAAGLVLIGWAVYHRPTAPATACASACAPAWPASPCGRS